MDMSGEMGAALLGAGRESMEVTVPQMMARAAVVYAVTLVIVRIGKKRFMGSSTAFDIIVGIILGSTVSRTMTGNAPLAPTLAAAAMLVAMHWLMSEIAMRWRRFGPLLKGAPVVLVRDGAADPDALRRCHIGEGDLDEALRANRLADLGRVAEARLERDGTISIIERPGEPRILEVAVAPGVQTVRIALG